MNQARKPIARLAADAGAVRHILFIEQDSAWGRKRMKTRGIQVVKELLDTRLMRYGWIGIWRTRRGLGRIYAAFAVHLIHLLGLRVERLHVVVADWPGRRNPVVFAQFPEILLAQT